MADSLQFSAALSTPAIPAPATPSDPRLGSDVPALPTATGVYVCIHGHFYQPPRENPYLNVVERQSGAAPFHDWNERIHHECYRPNAFARILSHRGEVMRIVNNYEYISFNLGPTLLSWMEGYDPETYQRILEADRRSCARLNGHGNAIAQVYNHIIMPLANRRDKYTQIRWGKADFKHRFGRDPEGMWLAETAVDAETLEALIDEGIRFIILAPSQVQRCRPMAVGDQPPGDWFEVGGGQIDPSRPYRCFLKDDRGIADPERYIDIFFYDGPISRDMGFNDVLSSSQHFAGRLGQAIHGDHRPAQLISVATDGETFGHHRGGAEKTLAYAVTQEFPQHGWGVTNYAHYLSLHPPTWEAELKPVTAWSCAHGVDRWQEDCGCGGGGAWNQQWRRPLRQALDWLRDRLIAVYSDKAPEFFADPWAARDDYIRVVCDRSEASLKRFFQAHQSRKLSRSEWVEALQLLEMQRHALFMYTSCGWFFEELSRPEGTQILRYAARALELAGEVAGVELETEFVRRLAQAPSNVPDFKDGAGVYRQLVIPAKVSLEQVAAHYAMSSLFVEYRQEQHLFCYTITQRDYQLQRMGPIALAVGQIQIVSEITREKLDLSFAVLHLGGWDFHCCIQSFRSRLAYTRAKDELFEVLGQASATQTILAINRLFGERAYSLQDLFAEERHRIMRLLSQETLLRLDQLYSQVYRDNYGVLRAFHRDGLPVPQELQVAAEIALSQRALEVLEALERDTSDPDVSPLRVGGQYLDELDAIATEAGHFQCRLTLPGAKSMLEGLVWRSVWHLLSQPQPDTISADVDWLSRLIAVPARLSLNLSLDRTQELYYQHLYTVLVPHLIPASNGKSQATSNQTRCMQHLLRLGQCLAIDVFHLLAHLDNA
jgi:alpha-amylase/alpha-mannosidase (GH57 family)